MVKDAYNYLFHCSEYRSADRRWACFHKDDQSFYWTGPGPDKYGAVVDARITYGKSPAEAWAEIELKYEQLIVV